MWNRDKENKSDKYPEFVARPKDEGETESYEDFSNREELEDKPVASYGYIVGGVCVDADHEAVIAKEIVSSNGSTYFVRVGSYGNVNGQFLDPWSSMYPGENVGYINARIDGNTRRFEFRRVSQKCFQHYLNFLKGKHARELRYAEREGIL